MSEDLAFLRAVVAAPTDDALRLVYADWLDDRDDPRAAFLRTGRRDGLDPRWLAVVDRSQAGWPIIRAKPERTYGTAVPTFIHNMQFHYATLDVFADGSINCWGFVDLPLFRGKLASGWVDPRPPVGESVSVHNLGWARVAAAEWDRTSADLERQVADLIRAWNPALERLVDMQGSGVEIRNGVRHAKGSGWGQAQPFRPTPDGDDVRGTELPVLAVTDAGYRLVHWLLYADGLTQLRAGTELLPVDAVAGLFAAGRLTLAVPDGKWILLDGLGRFQTADGHWGVDPAERVREATDEIDQLNGRPGVVARCIKARLAYEAAPGDERREALRAAYGAVPRHRRIFCGDMDTKDGPIRAILAGRR